MLRVNGDFNAYAMLIPKGKAIFVNNQKGVLKLLK